MKKVIDYIHSLRLKLEEYGDWLERYNRNFPNAFNMIFNDLTLTLEFLDYYYRSWPSLDVSAFSAKDVERKRKEKIGRGLCRLLSGSLSTLYHRWNFL